ncbi:hypothetical protein D3C80_1131280 [compost metagenome]
MTGTLNTKVKQMTENLKAKNRNTTNINILPLKAVFLALWGMGLIVSKGFWWTLACIFPPIGAGTSVLWLIEHFTGVWV